MKKQVEILDVELVNLKVSEGEIYSLDALIEVKNYKKFLENEMQLISDFEQEYIDKISREANEHPNGYKGFLIKEVSGRKSFNFKGISEVENAKSKVSDIESKYKAAFEGFQKGTVQTVEDNGTLYWIDSDGELREFPELTIGKSYITIKQSK